MAIDRLEMLTRGDAMRALRVHLVATAPSSNRREVGVMPLPQDLLQSTAAIHAANDFLGQACRELIEVRAEREQLRVALKETREALNDARENLVYQVKYCEAQYRRREIDEIEAVLARHAGLVEEVGRG